MLNFTFKKVSLFIGDSIIFWSALFLALYIRRHDIFDFAYFFDHVHTFIFTYVVFITSIFIAGLYEMPQFLLKIKKVKLISYISISSFVFGVLYFYLFPSDYTPKIVLLMQCIIAFVLLSLWRVLSENIFSKKNKTKALLLDDCEEAKELYDHVLSSDYNFSFIEDSSFSSLSKMSGVDFENINNINAFKKRILENNIELIVADLANKNMQNILPIIYDISIKKSKIKIYSTRNFYQYIYRKMPLKTVGYHWFFDGVTFESKIYEVVKRVVDILVSLPIALLWLFLHPWVARKIKQEDGGEIFITQERLGKYGNKIKIKKYRTMTHSDGGKWLTENDNTNKVTEIGYFLRKTRIDELPQILAILKGDLTLIGPRSDMESFAERMKTEVNFYMLRYAVKPGLSGWAQTMMTKPPQSVEETIERLRYDLYYVKNRSLILDFIIGLKTIKTILSREGM